MSITDQRRGKRSEQPSLFLSPTNRPMWTQLPQPCRQEARKLIAQMFIAQVTRGKRVHGDEEADHE